MTRRALRLSTRFARCSTTTAPSARSPSTACCGSNRSWSPPNDYNPNNVAPPEKRLLQTSLEADGFTQPVVVIQQRPQAYTIVDGFHRHELACSKAALKKTLKGYLPVTCLTSEAASRDGLMAATIRHNRARGRHQIHAMSEIVRELTQLGWTPQKIGKELGMDADEVLRLKQISGLTEMFAGRQFSQAWTIK